MEQSKSDEELIEHVRREETNRSSILSDQNNNPASKKEFKKHGWLNHHFDIVDKKTICKHCKKKYSNKHSARLAGHIQKLHKEQIEEGFDEIPVMASEKKINNLMVMCLIESNIPLNVVERRSFKEWIREMNCDWSPPNRRDLSGALIPRLSRKLHDEFKATALKLTAPSLSIEFDHWKDANGTSLLGVIATTSTGKRHLLDLRDTSEKGHFTSVIVEDLVDILKEIPSRAINSIVSDSAASCKKARLDLIELENYSHVIQHRCTAHLLNRIGQRITTKDSMIADILETAAKVTSLISSSAFWQASLKRLNQNKIKPACPTRWYSTVNMIESLLNVKTVILETILPRVAEEKARIIQALDWDKLQSMLEVLKPINKCIGVVEAKDVSLGQAFASILEFAKDLFNPQNDSEFLSSARTAFLWHFSPKRINKDELGLFLAAYVLDRRNRMKYVTQDGIYLALEAMALIARSSNPLKRIKSSLIDEFESYRNLREDYAPDDAGNNPIRWWSKKPSSILMQVAIRLAHLKASSTNIERTFSTLRHIQGGSRMNLSMSTLIDVGRLKIGTSLIYDSDGDEFDLTSYDSAEQQLWPRKEIEETGQESQDDELNSSKITDTSQITDSSENIESYELSNWLETQSLEIVDSYKWFFKYLNFSVIVEQANADGSQSQTATIEQIRQLIQETRDSQNYGVIIDSASQMARFNGADIEEL